MISDCDKFEVRNYAHSILQALFIHNCLSKPHYQHHDFYDLCYQIVKCFTNTILDRTGAPSYMWLLDLIYVFVLLKHTHASGISGIPITNATGSISDISPLLNFFFGNWSITKYITHIYLHIALKNMVAGMLSPNMLDMIWTSRYLIMIPIRSSLVITFALMSNPWNSIFALTLFMGGHIPLSNCVQKEIIKLFHVLAVLKENTNRIKHPSWMKNFLKKKLMEKLVRLMHPNSCSEYIWYYWSHISYATPRRWPIFPGLYC